MPYRDAWEIRGPAPYLVYAVIARVFGTAQWLLRALDLSILATGAWCVSSIAAAFGGRLAGRVAVVLYVLWFASLGHHDTAQSDGWNAAMMTAVALCMLANRGSPRARHAAIAGVLIGLSIVSKPPARITSRTTSAPPSAISARSVFMPAIFFRPATSTAARRLQISSIDARVST